MQEQPGSNLLRSWIARAAARAPDKSWVIGADDGRTVSYGELHEAVGRFAAFLRTRGIGRRILEFLMETARERGYRRAILHAQTSAEGFYIKNGYVQVGEIFDEAGIPHRKMERDL